MSEGDTIRVGADLIRAQQVTESIIRFGDRYLQRIYTEHAIASCTGLPSVVDARLAARFAAKEATIKVLQPTDHQPNWRSMEVRRHDGGWCSMSLSGHAAELAERAGIVDLVVSLTHDEDVAGAVVVAVCRPSAIGTYDPGTQLSELLLNEAR
jgi:holo-[acyl-carrier protein] synthase